MDATECLEFKSWVKPRAVQSIGIDRISAKPDELILRAVHNSWVYYVYLDLTERGRHHCTCLDGPHCEAVFSGPNGENMICRHIVAAALSQGQETLVLPFLLQAAR